jgi:hypothetical protein
MNFKASPIKSMRLLIVSGTLRCWEGCDAHYDSHYHHLWSLWVVFKCLSEAQTLRVRSSSRFIVIKMADTVRAGWTNSFGLSSKFESSQVVFLWRPCLQHRCVPFCNCFLARPPPHFVESLLSFATNIQMNS